MVSHPSALDRRTFVTGTGAALGTAALSGVGSADPPERAADGGTDRDRHGGDDDRPTLIAHRGFAGVYPENTVGAVDRASRGGNPTEAAMQGAAMIEIDVLPTSDGEVVVFHDDDLSGRDDGERGLTDKSGLVWETPWAEVRDAEVLGSGETVPKLTQVLDAIPASVGVNVELKNPGSGDLRFARKLSGEALAAAEDRWREFVADVIDVTDRYGNDFLFSSFYEGALSVTRELDSSIPLATLFWSDLEDGLAITREYDSEAIHPPYNTIAGTPFYEDEYFFSGPFPDVDLVEIAHEEGREVNVYTLATWYQAQELAAAGVDGIIADYPNLLSF
jgi:glycerophosphoryl diester phosphodiesterase